MRKSKWTEAQIIVWLQETEAGTSVAELCRRIGVSKETVYSWRKTSGGMKVSDAKRRRQLEEEHRALKRVVADQALIIQVLKDVAGKGVVTPEQRRTVVAHVCTTVEVSERAACRFLGMYRAVIRYRTQRADDPALIAALTMWVEQKRRWGVPRLTNKLRRVGVRVLTILDEGTREAVALVVARRITGQCVADTLRALARTRGLPHTIAVDNGTEFTSEAMDQWATQADVHLAFSRPGKPNDNAFIESFNSRLRDECLNEHWCLSMADAQRRIERFRHEYLTEHRHSSLGGLTPAEYVGRFTRSAPAEITQLSA